LDQLLANRHSKENRQQSDQPNLALYLQAGTESYRVCKTSYHFHRVYSALYSNQCHSFMSNVHRWP